MMNSDQKKSIDAFNDSVYGYEQTICKLQNYNETYDYFSDLLAEDYTVLDLACGPGNISAYLCKKKKISVTGFDLSIEMLNAARQKIPEGSFIQQSIIDFSEFSRFNAAVNGFGIPYLTEHQVEESITNTSRALKENGWFYISFMEGTGISQEIPSFNNDVEIMIHYHEIKTIKKILKKAGFEIKKKWNLEYQEQDGSVTADIVIIAQKK